MKSLITSTLATLLLTLGTTHAQDVIPKDAPVKEETAKPFSEKKEATPEIKAEEQPAPDTTVKEEERPVPPTYEGAFLKMIVTLIILLAVIFLGVWLIRRLSHSRLHMFKEPKHIRIIDRRPLSQKTALYLVEVGDKRVLVAESQLEVKRLTEVDLLQNSPD